MQVADPQFLPLPALRRIAALVTAQAAKLERAKKLAAAEDLEERKKNAAAGTGPAARKRRRMEAKGKAKAGPALTPTSSAAPAVDEDLSGDEVEEATGVKAVAVEARKAVKPRKRGTIPFAQGEHVLLVGEGNFSYAASLLLMSPPVLTPHLLTATSYDSAQAVHDKYPDAKLHLDALVAAGATVLFGVDATALAKTPQLKGREFDRVVFNFPHTGQGITDQARNVRANQTLLLLFFRSVTPLLRQGLPSAPEVAKSKKGKGKKRRVDSDDEDNVPVVEDEDEDGGVLGLAGVTPAPPKTAGTVLITLRTALPYSLWSVPQLGTKGPLLAPSILPRPLPRGQQPTFKIKRSFEFDLRDYEGYEHRRTVGYVAGVSSRANEDLTLTARERGLKRREEKEAKEREEKEERMGTAAKGAIRTTEFELVPEKDEDDAYDDDVIKGVGDQGMRKWGGK